MYTCICNRVSDNEIRKIIENNSISSITQLTKFTLVGNTCGNCINHAKEIINSYIVLDTDKHI